MKQNRDLEAANQTLGKDTQNLRNESQMLREENEKLMQNNTKLQIDFDAGLNCLTIPTPKTFADIFQPGRTVI
jgi:hypothetical protein